MESINIRPSLPGIFPLGLRFHLRAKTKDSVIRSYVLISFSGQSLTVRKSIISTNLLNKLIGQGSILFGDINLEGTVKFKNNNPDQGAFSIQSNNIALQKANIQGIELPRLNIGKLDIRIYLKDGKLITLEKADIGTNDADSIGRFGGTTNFNVNNPLSSQVDIEGAFFLGEKLTKAVPLINLFLQSKNVDDNGFYSLRLSGAVGNLSPEIL